MNTNQSGGGRLQCIGQTSAEMQDVVFKYIIIFSSGLTPCLVLILYILKLYVDYLSSIHICKMQMIIQKSNTVSSTPTIYNKWILCYSLTITVNKSRSGFKHFVFHTLFHDHFYPLHVANGLVIFFLLPSCILLFFLPLFRGPIIFVKSKYITWGAITRWYTVW